MCVYTPIRIWWLYSSTNSKWMIGGEWVKEMDFKCEKGFIYLDKRHGGVLPHKMPGCWEWWDKENGKWFKDSHIKIEAVIVDALTDVVVDYVRTSILSLVCVYIYVCICVCDCYIYIYLQLYTHKYIIQYRGFVH